MDCSSWELGNVAVCKCELEEDEVRTLVTADALQGLRLIFPRSLFHTIYTARSTKVSESARNREDAKAKIEG